jgi:ATP-dependent Lon protease
MSDDNNKFKNGKIYTIRNRNDETLIYVGSTVQPLYKRFSQHKKDSISTRCENMLLYKKMNETDFNDWYIELYIDYPCERKEQLTQREGEIIRQIGTLNKRIAGRTAKDYYEDESEQKKILKEINKEEIKEYFEFNEDKIKEYYEDEREQKKILKEIKKSDKNYYLTETNSNIS